MANQIKKWSFLILQIFVLGIICFPIFLGNLSHPADEVALALAVPVTVLLTIPGLVLALLPEPKSDPYFKQLEKHEKSFVAFIVGLSVTAAIGVLFFEVGVTFILSAGIYSIVGLQWAVPPSLFGAKWLLIMTPFYFIPVPLVLYAHPLIVRLDPAARHIFLRMLINRFVQLASTTAHWHAFS